MRSQVAVDRDEWGINFFSKKGAEWKYGSYMKTEEALAKKKTIVLS